MPLASSSLYIGFTPTTKPNSHLSLTLSLILSCLSPEEAAGMMTTIEPFENVFVITSDNATDIGKLLNVTQLCYIQVNHAVNGYAPAAAEASKGITTKWNAAQTRQP